MKTIRKHIIRNLAAALPALLLLGACELFGGPPKPELPQPGLVILRLGGGEPGMRTLTPSVPEFSEYNLVFSADEKSPVDLTISEAPDRAAAEGPGYALELETGEWTVEVTAYTGEGEGKRPAAVGTGTFTASPVRTDPVWITLRPPAAGQGVFAWNIDVTPGASDIKSGTLSLSPSNKSPVNMEYWGNRHTQWFLDAGYYTMRLILNNNAGKRMDRIEAVHIYPGLTTEAAYTFTDADFSSVSVRPAAGTVQITAIPGGNIISAVTVQACRDEALTEPLGGAVEAAGDNRDWILTVPQNISNFYMKISVTLSGSYEGTYSGSGGRVTVNNDYGVNGVDLPLGGIYTLSYETTGGTWTDANPRTIAAVQRARKPDDPVKDGHLFGGWYKEAELTNTWNFDTDTVTENITLYAKWIFLPPSETVTYGGVSYLMKEISGGTVSAGKAWGSSDNYPLPYTVGGYKMGETEITYELWYAVKQWAGNNGYTFANAGREGKDGADGAGPTGASKEPVTNISWRDAVVWCNAYSEAAGKTPVYYYEVGFSTILKVSEGGNIGAGDGGAEKAYINPNANGFCLPTEGEWEYAARGGDPGDTTNWNYTYAGSNAAGDVAWYRDNSSNKTHEVKGKAGNRLGLHDMSGNVWEWCGDKYFGDTYRLVRSGSWNYDANGCSVVYRTSNSPTSKYSNVGFRVVCR